MPGYLELILGPMFSGKTTYIINLYDLCIQNKQTVTVINFADDTRYHDKMLSSHDRIMIPCTFTRKLHDILHTEEVQKSDNILINEGQFFEDLYECVIYLVETLHKKVHICGLDGDFKRQKFGTILDLVPLCDKVIKLQSKCEHCNGQALFSHRITREQEQVVIGVQNYVPLCRSCYVKENYKNNTSSVQIALELSLDIL
jgi:thymidine kinase